ncbi:MAG: hypothetical protein ABSF69_18175 [Polyangiaceae bacterium]|jgi:hypothetical protein
MSSARGPGQGMLDGLTMRLVSQREKVATEALASILLAPIARGTMGLQGNHGKGSHA